MERRQRAVLHVRYTQVSREIQHRWNCLISQVLDSRKIFVIEGLGGWFEEIKVSSRYKVWLCFHVTSLLCIKYTGIPQIAFGHCRA